MRRANSLCWLAANSATAPAAIKKHTECWLSEYYNTAAQSTSLAELISEEWAASSGFTCLEMSHANSADARLSQYNLWIKNNSKRRVQERKIAGPLLSIVPNQHLVHLILASPVSGSAAYFLQKTIHLSFFFTYIWWNT